MTLWFCGFHQLSVYHKLLEFNLKISNLATVSAVRWIRLRLFQVQFGGLLGILHCK